MLYLFFFPLFTLKKETHRFVLLLQSEMVTNDSEPCLFPSANNVVNYTNRWNIYGLLIFYFMVSHWWFQSLFNDNNK